MSLISSVSPLFLLKNSYWSKKYLNTWFTLRGQILHILIFVSSALDSFHLTIYLSLYLSHLSPTSLLPSLSPLPTCQLLLRASWLIQSSLKQRKGWKTSSTAMISLFLPLSLYSWGSLHGLWCLSLVQRSLTLNSAQLKLWCLQSCDDQWLARARATSDKSSSFVILQHCVSHCCVDLQIETFQFEVPYFSFLSLVCI